MMPEPSIEELEFALLSQLREGYQRKVALIVATATERFPDLWEVGSDSAEALIDEALARLALRDDVRAFGDIKNWRFSEMCRARFVAEKDAPALDAFLRDELVKLADTDEGRRSLYRHRSTGALWELSHPQSEMQGMGPRTIRETLFTDPAAWS